MANLMGSRFLRSKPNTVTNFLSSIQSFAHSSASRTRSLPIRERSTSQVDSSSPPDLPPKEIIWPERNLSSVVGSEEEAKKRIYSVSTRYCNAYGALLSEDLANSNRGEPFVNGKAAAYNPMYHDASVSIHGEENEEDIEADIEANIEADIEADKQFQKQDDEVMGVDYKHWIIFMEKPRRLLSRDEIIKSYIKTLADVVGGEEEARMKIYSVSTRATYQFCALMDQTGSKKLYRMGVDTNPDYYEDVENKKYNIVEPFINGEAVPYDPKYHKGYRNKCPEFDWFLISKKNEHHMQKRKLENNIKKDEANMKKRELIDISPCSSWLIPALAVVPA